MKFCRYYQSRCSFQIFLQSIWRALLDLFSSAEHIPLLNTEHLLQYAFQPSQYVQLQQTAKSTLTIPISNNIYPRHILTILVTAHLHYPGILQLLPKNGQHDCARTVCLRELTIPFFIPVPI